MFDVLDPIRTRLSELGAAVYRCLVIRKSQRPASYTPSGRFTRDEAEVGTESVWARCMMSPNEIFLFY